MKPLLAASLLAATLATPALAQTVLTGPGETTTTTTVIENHGATGSLGWAPEDDTVVRRTIIEERRAPAARLPGQIRVGSVIPDDVTLYDMPADARSDRLALTDYEYFVSPDEKFVVVEPSTRQVVRILDRR